MTLPGQPFYLPRPVHLHPLWIWHDLASGHWILWRQVSPVEHRAEAVCRTRALARLAKWALVALG